jgi:membrane fusion protein (multidrug efflux system)
MASLTKYEPRLAAAVCLALLSATGCKDGAKQAAAAQAGPPPAVVATKVVQKTVPIYGEFVGQIQAAASVDIVARVEGVLKEMNFTEGQPVQKGQVLYVIDAAEYQAKVNAAKAALTKAESALDQAQSQVGVRSAEAELAQQRALLAKAEQDVARFKPLVEKRAIPQLELDGAMASATVNRANVEASQARLQNQVVNTKAQIDLAKADVDSARASLTQAELNLSYCVVRAPMNGLIGRTRAYPGALLSRGSVTVLNTLAAINPAQVTFGIPETAYLTVRRRNQTAKERLQTAQSLQAELILADNTMYPYKGQFTMVDSTIDQKTGTLSILMSFPNPDGLLRPNGFGRVRLIVGMAEDALLIPQKAVIEQQGGSAVFVVGPDNKVSQRTVVLGPQFESSVIVTQGLKAGERIVVEGQQKARPGMPVNPSERAITSEAGEQ